MGDITAVRGGRRIALTAIRLSLPRSAGVRLLPSLKAGASSEEPGDRRQVPSPRHAAGPLKARQQGRLPVSGARIRPPQQPSPPVSGRPGLGALADLGFVGLDDDPDDPAIVTGRRATRGHPLTDARKEANRLVGRYREPL
ncbi:hypothetical protein [Streptomyces chiangmaiensis]|uniref:Uncharacterized protein n=1 Tax=Streptomyces chiangmaiensis TaxID=766497 RepID=A0ABU7FQN3_9ACTN|nr:hypothetical protein [Streptomyces chiangmaiensis]MED7826412.1 hypothetical protein [Streptomyces chiangmaiensis]